MSSGYQSVLRAMRAFPERVFPVACTGTRPNVGCPVSAWDKTLQEVKAAPVELLAQAPWVASLTPPQWQRAQRETLITHRGAGEVVSAKGAPARHWIGVLEGMVKVDGLSADGRSTTLSGVSSGGWLGEGSMLKHERRPYEVVALQDSWLALMPAATFDWLCETSLGFNQFLVRQLNARLGQFLAVVESHRIQTTTSQVAVCLCELVNPALCTPVAGALRLSQEEIARLCGLSRQVTGRALHELEARGLVAMRYGGIEVLDIAGLQAAIGGTTRNTHEGASA